MRSRDIVVFLGPSLDRASAEKILEADYRPPAKRGDVFRAAKEGAKIVGLIDGVFFQESAVAHKEVLRVLEMGVVVVGASSMGALRAAELHQFGMEGVGEIFRLYRDGVLISDDEVALIFDPIKFEPLSEPLVNIRDNVKVAQKNGIIDAEAGEKILAAASSLYFPKRSYDRILTEAEDLDECAREAFRSFLLEERRDLKKDDAKRALERIKEIALRP
ncbi:TfuA-related McrA-glycine thioamidation protein [Methanocrinis sp.]|uniref:TfuA-related McrA-glycine thioamidation protein n=1 Tax=Methanocrinis sp. TaxID=3101522 RepID=UPI003D0FD044